MPEIEARNLHDIWFQQDGATCNTARETMDLLRSRFGEQFISRRDRWTGLQDRVISHLWTFICGVCKV